MNAKSPAVIMWPSAAQTNKKLHNPNCVFYFRTYSPRVHVGRNLKEKADEELLNELLRHFLP